jgi:hypothetical protein
MANPEHLAKLVQGVEAWNQWAELETDSATNLSGTDFELVDLSRADLNRIPFRGNVPCSSESRRSKSRVG